MLPVRDVKMLSLGEPGSRYEGDLLRVVSPDGCIEVCEASCVLYTKLSCDRDSVSSTRLFRLPLALCAV